MYPVKGSSKQEISEYFKKVLQNRQAPASIPNNPSQFGQAREAQQREIGNTYEQLQRRKRIKEDAMKSVILESKYEKAKQHLDEEENKLENMSSPQLNVYVEQKERDPKITQKQRDLYAKMKLKKANTPAPPPHVDAPQMVHELYKATKKLKKAETTNRSQQEIDKARENYAQKLRTFNEVSEERGEKRAEKVMENLSMIEEAFGSDSVEFWEYTANPSEGGIVLRAKNELKRLKKSGVGGSGTTTTRAKAGKKGKKGKK